MADDIFFYRNLFSEAHRKRWDAGLYRSTNERHGVPKAWVAAAIAGKPVEEFPLETDGVLFDKPAREKFVTFVEVLRAKTEGPLTPDAVYTAFDKQPRPVRQQQLELAGVCAFPTPAAAYWYGQEAAKPDDELIVFTGVKVADLAPEKAQGSVIATVTEVVCRLDPQAFLVKYFDGIEPASPHAKLEKGKGLAWDDEVKE